MTIHIPSLGRFFWIGAFGLPFGFGFGALGMRAYAHIRYGEVAPAAERASTAKVDFTELALVFVTSSSCGAAEDPALPAEVRQLKSSLRAEANRRGLEFATIGIAVDAVPANGLDALRPFGYFDEINTGHGLYSSGAQHYLARDLPGIAATPQALVVQRRILGESEGLVMSEVVLARVVGIREIGEWVAAGAPLPGGVPGRSSTAFGDTAVRIHPEI